MSDHESADERERRRRAELETEMDAEFGAQDRERKRRIREDTGRVQLALTRVELLRRGLLDRAEFAERAQGNWWLNEVTGELRAWWLIDGRAYYRKDDVVYVESTAHGRMEWTILDGDGEHALADDGATGGQVGVQLSGGGSVRRRAQTGSQSGTE